MAIIFFFFSFFKSYRFWQRAVTGGAAAPSALPSIVEELVSMCRVQCSFRVFMAPHAGDGSPAFILLWFLNLDCLVVVPT